MSLVIGIWAVCWLGCLLFIALHHEKLSLGDMAISLTISPLLMFLILCMGCLWLARKSEEIIIWKKKGSW